MDNVDTKASASADVSHLQSQLDSLNHLVVSVLVLVVVMSGTLSIYLLRQWRMASKDLAAFQPAALQIVAEYNQERKPRMDAFIDRLKEYGRTHPDFVPILTRYQLVPNPQAAGSAPASNTPKK